MIPFSYTLNYITDRNPTSLAAKNLIWDGKEKASYCTDLSLTRFLQQEVSRKAFGSNTEWRKSMRDFMQFEFFQFEKQD